MIGIDVRADIRQAEKFLRDLSRGAIRRAASRAINDALVTVRMQGAAAIKAKHPALKVGIIKENISTERSTPRTLTGQVYTKGRPLSVTLFDVRGGVGHRVRRGPRGQTILTRTNRPLTARLGTTRAQVQVGNRKGFRVLQYGNEVFVRRNPKGRQLRRFRGPSMPGVFRARAGEFEQIARSRFAVTFPSRLQYEIAKAKQQAT